MSFSSLDEWYPLIERYVRRGESMSNAFQVERKLRERLPRLRADEAREIVQALDWLDLVVVDRQEWDYLQARAAELDELELRSAEGHDAGEDSSVRAGDGDGEPVG